MRERAVVPLAVLLAVLPVRALAQQDLVWGTELEGRPARPHIIVAPRYPKEAAEQKRVATVDINGSISASGMMEKPAFRSSSDDPAFEREVAEVVKLWIFRAPVSEDCRPKGGEAQLRVWFEIGEGGPKVSISVPKDATRPAGGIPDLPKVVRKEIPRYPRSAIQRGVQGARVIALVRVTSSGDVDQVAFQDTGVDKDFLRESERALLLWKFETDPARFKGASHICAQVPIDYRLTN